MSDEQFKGFLTNVFENYAEIMDPFTAIYVFHDESSTQREFEDAINFILLHKITILCSIFQFYQKSTSQI
jgi:hypothetical protein